MNNIHKYAKCISYLEEAKTYIDSVTKLIGYQLDLENISEAIDDYIYELEDIIEEIAEEEAEEAEANDKQLSLPGTEYL